MKTRNGIYYDLTVSPIRFKTMETGLTFVFSSDLHKIKFMERYLHNRQELNVKLTARYRINMCLTSLPDVTLYKSIEKRGFLIIDEKGEKLCQQNLLLSGETVTRKN